MIYTAKTIAEITNCELIGNSDLPIQFFSTDSRAITSVRDTLFIAIKTQRNNGHNYIPLLIQKGVKHFLIQGGELDILKFQDSSLVFLVSENPLSTLQHLAAQHRSKFNIPVIGITGSNGKTIVKEWLYQLLKADYNICRSPKSYNSQIGVPLSVLNLNKSHTLAIFEAGISQPNEMEKLERIIQPTLGVFTSFGDAHNEGFMGKDQKLHEKVKLFLNTPTVIANGVPEFENTLNQTLLNIGESGQPNFLIQSESNGFDLLNNNERLHFHIPFSDKASILNAATCAVLLLSLGYSAQKIQERLQSLQSLSLRLEIKNGIQNSLIINDYYNSDLDSIKIAIGYLQQQTRKNKTVIVLSDIEQSGLNSKELYTQLANLLNECRIDLLVGIGKEIKSQNNLFGSNNLFFESTSQFLTEFKHYQHVFANSTILLKGARSFGFESISRLFQLKSHDTVFEIDLNKLISNVNYFRSKINSQVKVMAMVKAMGYGSGSIEVARVLQHIGVNYLAVAYADEGVELKEAGIQLPVMVMNPEEDGLDDIINYRLEPEIYSFKVLHSFLHKLEVMGVTEPYPIHIKLDTGMHRLGFEAHQIAELFLLLKHQTQLKVVSIFSHLAASDNPQLDDFTHSQINAFKNMTYQIEKELGYSSTKHICNSGAISRFTNAHFDMVRLGIGMYGLGVNQEEQNFLQNVGCLKTRISQIKKVKAGDTVSYNRSGKIDHETTLATLPIGYADGFNRLLGNGKFSVLINGVLCKTVGNICMDMCMVDITGVKCSEGDEVIIFESVQQINDLAKMLQTIPYEVLTNVSGRVKRVYVQE